MMQYPSGVEYNLSTIPEKGYYEYIWVPLDAEDYNYVPNNKLDPARAASMLLRNGIHIYAYGSAQTDKFQIQTIETWEYVPTYTFKPFAPNIIGTSKESDKQ